MHQQLEETSMMWESLAAAALTLELPTIESPPLSNTEDSGLMDRSVIGARRNIMNIATATGSFALDARPTSHGGKFATEWMRGHNCF
jgi:hypothetical protein